jgi:transcriptional regulator with XRE-family HTH domain
MGVIMSIFCERLIKLQTERNLLKKDIANDLGISVMAYYRYEKGVRQPDLPLLVSIADFYDVSIDYITGRNDNPDSHTITLEWQNDIDKIMGNLMTTAAANPELEKLLKKLLKRN